MMKARERWFECKTLGLEATCWEPDARGRWQRVEHLGAGRLLYGTLPDYAPNEKVIVSLAYTVHSSIEAGHTYEFRVHQSNLKFFDPTTTAFMKPVDVYPDSLKERLTAAEVADTSVRLHHGEPGKVGKRFDERRSV